MRHYPEVRLMFVMEVDKSLSVISRDGFEAENPAVDQKRSSLPNSASIFLE